MCTDKRTARNGGRADIARFAAANPCRNRGADRQIRTGLSNAARPERGLPTTTLCRLIEHAVDLARHDEIVLVQSLDLL
jgi:hypothetical protein